MKVWPVPNFTPVRLPRDGERGSFWENRGDRRHAGIDLYAPAGAKVVAAEAGTVLEVRVFTSPARSPYWNTTHSILIENTDGLVLRYAELDEVIVQPGEKVRAGQVLGSVGNVLALDRIDDESPEYIRALKSDGQAAMLHLEMHRCQPTDTSLYQGGNYYVEERPTTLLDPTPYLQPLLETSSSKVQ